MRSRPTRGNFRYRVAQKIDRTIHIAVAGDNFPARRNQHAAVIHRRVFVDPSRGKIRPESISRDRGPSFEALRALRRRHLGPKPSGRSRPSQRPELYDCEPDTRHFVTPPAFAFAQAALLAIPRQKPRPSSSPELARDDTCTSNDVVEVLAVLLGQARRETDIPIATPQ